MGIKITGQTIQYLILSAVSLAAITAGVTVYWSTPMIPKFHSHQADIEISDEEASWIASLSSPGYVVGSLLSSFIVDRFGRRVSIIGSAVPMGIGVLIVQFATKAWMIYIMRLIWGVATGFFMTVSGIYLAEIADKEIRGKLSVAIRFTFNFGSFLVLSVGSIVSYSTLNRLLIVLPIAHFAACLFIPETPQFYIKENKIAAAKKSLKLLRRSKNEDEIQEQLDALRTDVKKETRRPATTKELFTGKQYRKAVIITIGIKITQVMSGPLSIQHYAGLIIQRSHESFPLSVALTSVGATRIIAGVFSLFLIDKVGRRPLLNISYFGTGIILVINGIYFYFEEVVGMKLDPSSPFRYLTFISIISTTFLTTIGYNSLVYVIPAELFPINVKSLALTYFNIFGGFLNFIVVKGFQNMMDWTGYYGVFWYFGIFSLLGGIFSYFFVIETKGKSLREIQMELQGDLYEDPEELKNLNVVPTDTQNNDFKENTELKEIERKNTQSLKESTESLELKSKDVEKQ